MKEIYNDEYKDGDPYEIDHESSFHRRRVGCTLEMIKQIGIAGPEILDIGCGRGHITNSIHTELPDAKITGIDVSKSAIEYAQKNYPDIKFYEQDARNLSLEPERFDIIVCNNLWEHVPDPSAVLEEIGRVSKPGGYLIISTPSRYRLINLARAITGMPVKLMNKYHVTEYTVGQVIEQLRFGGYDVLMKYSRPIWTRKKGILGPIYSVCVMAASILIKLTQSHHIFESTMFFMARKKSGFVKNKLRRDMEN